MTKRKGKVLKKCNCKCELTGRRRIKKKKNSTCIFYLFISTNISFYYSNFCCSVLYLPYIQLNFISFKFIIQISHHLRNNEIIIIIKNHHKITMLS